MEHEGKKLMTLKDVMTTLSLSRSTITRMIKAGKFPKALEFSRKLYWTQEQINEFFKNLKEREK